MQNNPRFLTTLLQETGLATWRLAAGGDWRIIWYSNIEQDGGLSGYQVANMGTCSLNRL